MIIAVANLSIGNQHAGASRYADNWTNCILSSASGEIIIIILEGSKSKLRASVSHHH